MQLRWMQPAGSAPVDWWRVYRDDLLVVEGVVSVPVAGVYSTELPGWPYAAEYYMTAVNESGESAPSNTLQLPEPGNIAIVAILLGLVFLRRFRR